MHEKILKESFKANKEIFTASEVLERDLFLYERFMELRIELEILRQRIANYEKKDEK